MVKHGEASKRRIEVVNLDPAAEQISYNPAVDVRELIDINDVMEELDYGPNGGLVYCMEYIIENKEWLIEKLADQDDDYLLFDVPGQIELFTHFNIISKLCQMLQDLNFRICGVYCLDSQFITDISKFISGTFTALSTQINLEIPFFNVLTKIDLLEKSQRRSIEKFLEPNSDFLEEDLYLNSKWGQKFKKLSKAISNLVSWSYGFETFESSHSVDSKLLKILKASELFPNIRES